MHCMWDVKEKEGMMKDEEWFVLPFSCLED